MNKKLEKRIRLKKKIRTKIFGDSKTPRLSVFRSNNYIYAQMIDDSKSITIASASDQPRGKAGMDIKGTKTERAIAVGANIAKVSNTKGIKACVFDRNGFKYTGRVKALADSARKAGLKF
ncbi:MAG: 50S ribosomal protein L18 [Candidatus Paceibacterota bacterium]|jgi:large subunit ribosomal protein L18